MSTATFTEPRTAPKADLRTRVSARLRSHELDRSLAYGTPPETDAALALHARRLTALDRRQVISHGLRRAVRQSSRGVAPSQALVAPHRSQVIAAGDELMRLADALAAPGPVAARGVAQARILLTDGTGPLYTMRGNLRARAADAADNLTVES